MFLTAKGEIESFRQANSRLPTQDEFQSLTGKLAERAPAEASATWSEMTIETVKVEDAAKKGLYYLNIPVGRLL